MELNSPKYFKNAWIKPPFSIAHSKKAGELDRF